MRVTIQKCDNVRELDREIEALREELHRLVRSNPSQLRRPDVYELSTRLDELIASLQANRPCGLSKYDKGCERSESIK